MVRFLGCFTLIGFEFRDAPDTDGKNRQAIIFNLLAQSDVIEFSLEEEQLLSTFDELRKKAYQDGEEAQPESSDENKQKAFKISACVELYALERAEGICERCTQPGPFETRSLLLIPYSSPTLDISYNILSALFLSEFSSP